MKYNETLEFVALCLTLSSDEKSVSKIHTLIHNIDWDSVVKVSTAHFVFPAMYIQLKKAGFLEYIPVELVAYMEHIFELNKERNEAILNQIENITRILNKENITPIFTKGTSHLLDHLYFDIGERMVGDIDLLIPKEQIQQAENLLFENDYQHFFEGKDNFQPENHRHLPRLVNDVEIAAVEIHKEMLEEKHASFFNYNSIKNTLKEINFRGTKLYVPSDEHQLVLNAVSLQLNDYGYYSGKIILRNMYDLLLLSNKVNSLKAIQKYPEIFNYLNAYLAISKKVFSNHKSIIFQKNIASKFYQYRCFLFLNSRKLTLLKNNIEISARIIKKSYLHISRPILRVQLFQKLRSKSWRKKKVIAIKKAGKKL
ncbi:nucleotidyltransferase family protein [Aureivirga marina]|uniref:nucleotidyltransferase family protein n=1 Tax=Aureivirga marina TaxID=1182451 RepID=UPI0018CA8945|nr:nucleotidyltransferase family protein [Aureivirga marina]